MPSAVVTGAVSRVYVSVWFLYDQTLMEVVAVNKLLHHAHLLRIVIEL